MSDGRGIVKGLFHRPEHHHRNGGIKRMVLDRLQELGEDLGIFNISQFYAKSPQFRAQHKKLLIVRRFMKPGKDFYSVRPKFLCHGFIGGNHAFLDHLVRFVIFPELDSCHLAVVRHHHFCFRNRQIQRSGGDLLPEEGLVLRGQGAGKQTNPDAQGRQQLGQ